MNVLIAYPQLLTALFSLSLIFTTPPTYAETGEPPDKTLSPYFYVNSNDPTIDRLPLQATEVKVNISGVIADVVVMQQYRNEGQHPLEARYLFPASSHAAVYGLQMQIGERVIEAKIREKQQARVEYEAAKSQGKSAALLEQERPNVFQMNVANILPGDLITVELHYTETIIPSKGTYQFVYPTVVGPRYNGSIESGSGINAQWVQTPYLKPEDATNASFAMTVNLASPIPIQAIESSTHQVNVQPLDEQHATINLAAHKDNSNRDFILNYQLAGNSIQTGTLLYRGQDENFFMTLVEPPKQLSAQEIVSREYIFILDISGSMNGFPIETAKTLLRKLVGNLRPTDTFNVMLFAGNNSMLAPNSIPARQQNIEQAIAVINQQSGAGSTELLPALRKALAMKKTTQRSRNFVIITDGYITVEKETFDLIRNNLNNANVFAFGIGASVNRFLMEGIAHAGEGEAFIVTNENEAKTVAETFKQYIESPVWTHLQLDIKGLDAYDVQPTKLPDLFAERPLVIIGKWRGALKGSVTVSGLTSTGNISETLDLNGSIIAPDAVALRYLWARQRIADLADYNKLMGGINDDEIREITKLGLKYTLLTDYTSFIAVDHIIRTNESSQTVDQPLPLPENVSELALGTEVPSTPEPEFYTMLAMAAGISAWLRRRKHPYGN